MDQHVQESLLAAIAGFQTGITSNLSAGIKLEPAHSALYHSLIEIFELKLDFMLKLKTMDDYFDSQDEFNDLREFCFDLLMINFFTTDSLRFEEDYLDTSEWQQIEDDTLERGTEMLNVFLYLRECKQEDIEPSLPDYLNEFLLVEDEDFQDEHEIYEDIISNQGLMDTGYAEISAAAKLVPSDAPLKDVFYPILSFFLNPAPDHEELNQFLVESVDKKYENAVFYSLLVYFLGQENFSLPLEA